jgi:hypothetical protein
MDSRHVIAVLALADRHWMKFELVRKQNFGFVAPFRNVEPEKAVRPLPQVGKLSDVVFAHAFAIDPAQLHRESPFNVVSTPRQDRS